LKSSDPGPRKTERGRAEADREAEISPPARATHPWNRGKWRGREWL